MAIQVPCPNCGPRPYTEFWFGSEIPAASPAPDAPDAETRMFERAWYRRNAPGVQEERWFHYAGCRRWLTLERDTRNNEIHGLVD